MNIISDGGLPFEIGISDRTDNAPEFACLKGVTYFDAVSSVIATIRTVSGFSR
jgi:hypothetical protein